MENLKDLSLEQLIALQEQITNEIARRKEAEGTKVLFNPSEHFSRYNGGWTKVVTGLNKANTNGYSIVGEFMPSKNKQEWYNTKALYLDCGIAGSRKNQRKEYKLFKVQEDGTPLILATAEGNDWAINLWEAIEKNLE